MKYKVGQLVVNPKLGLGKVLEVRGDNVTVFFKDEKDNPRTINVAVVPMAIPKDQSDPTLDELNARGKRGKWLFPKKKSIKPRAAKAKGTPTRKP
jgi:hypothetical protein